MAHHVVRNNLTLFEFVFDDAQRDVVSKKENNFFVGARL